jgi:hypothetical protein
MIHFVTVQSVSRQSQSIRTGVDTITTQDLLNKETQDEAREDALQNTDDEW